MGLVPKFLLAKVDISKPSGTSTTTGALNPLALIKKYWAEDDMPSIQLP